jgi:AcrR family transcriptional regulator
VTVQERILQAATRNFVRDGVMASRLEDIRRDAGVSVGAVYHHFPDKQALHAEAFLRVLAGYQAGFLETLQESNDAESGVKGVIHYHLRWVAENRDSAKLLLGERPSGPGAVERLTDQNRAFFKAALRWWRIHAGYGALRELDPELLHALWKGAADDYCRQWLAGRDRRLPTAVASELADAAWTTLKQTDEGQE